MKKVRQQKNKLRLTCWIHLIEFYSWKLRTKRNVLKSSVTDYFYSLETFSIFFSLNDKLQQNPLTCSINP